MNPSPETVAALALDTIRERGWHQGDFSRAGMIGDPVCLLGAINVVLTGSAYGEAMNAAPDGGCWALDRFGDSCAARVAHLLDIPRVMLSSWNDDPHTTFEDVTLVLKRVANGEGAE